MKAQTLSLADLLATPLEAESAPTKADAQATANWRKNLAALAKLQPAVVNLIESITIDLLWTFGRDGFLTGQDSQGYWWRGCSVPLLAGRESMKKLELTSTLGCFIWPHNAGQIRACFEIIQPKQAIIAVIPDPQTLAVILHCDNFSSEISAGRLLFAAGWDWSGQLAAVFQQFPGLPMPQQFIRTAALSDVELQPFINEGQRIIGAETNRRGGEIAKYKTQSNGQKISVLLIAAGSSFNVSDLAPTALIATLRKDDASYLDLDHPLSASPVALASAAQNIATIVTADIFRADVPGTIADDTQWITWITRGRIAAPDSNAPHDKILLADESWLPIARQAGWPSDRIALAGWPTGFLPAAARPSQCDLIALPADTQKIEIPPRVKEFSSHVLLWEAIAHELATDPLAVSTDPVRYLETRRHRMNIKHDGFSALIFLEKLIVPAYQQGLARLMLREKIPLVLLGRGWLEIPDLSEHSAGPMRSPQDLATSLAACRAIVHPMPNPAAHPVQAMGLPVFQPTITGLKKFLALKTISAPRRMTVLSREALVRLILARER